MSDKKYKIQKIVNCFCAKSIQQSLPKICRHFIFSKRYVLPLKIQRLKKIKFCFNYCSEVVIKTLCAKVQISRC